MDNLMNGVYRNENGDEIEIEFLKKDPIKQYTSIVKVKVLENEYEAVFTFLDAKSPFNTDKVNYTSYYIKSDVYGEVVSFKFNSENKTISFTSFKDNNGKIIEGTFVNHK